MTRRPPAAARNDTLCALPRGVWLARRINVEGGVQRAASLSAGERAPQRLRNRRALLARVLDPSPQLLHSGGGRRRSCPSHEPSSRSMASQRTVPAISASCTPTEKTLQIRPEVLGQTSSLLPQAPLSLRSSRCPLPDRRRRPAKSRPRRRCKAAAVIDRRLRGDDRTGATALAVRSRCVPEGGLHSPRIGPATRWHGAPVRPFELNSTPMVRTRGSATAVPEARGS